MSTARVPIDFIVDGERFAFRRWSHVPRQGELVLLKRGTMTVRVETVIWGDDSQNPGNPEDAPWAQLICKVVEHVAMVA
jgi:hypothetical protein